MADCSNGVSQQTAEINSLNAKLAYDAAAQLQHQAQLDNQEDSRAWAEIKLTRARNAAVIDNMVHTQAAISMQTGGTLNQQNINPISQGEGESTDAQAYPPNRSIDSNTALGSGVVLSAVATALTNGVNALSALVPVLVKSSGTASDTPKAS